MPLETSRRLLSGGRYTQLPPVPENDHVPSHRPFNASENISSHTPHTSHHASQYSSSSPLQPHQQSQSYLANGHHISSHSVTSASSTREQLTSSYLSSTIANGSSSTSSIRNTSSVNRNGSCDDKHLQNVSDYKAITNNGTSFGTGVRSPVGLRSYASSSLVHLDGAVVPQLEPHNCTLQPVASVHTEVRMTHGRPYVRPIQPSRHTQVRPPRHRSPSSSTVFRPPPSPTSTRPPLTFRPCTRPSNKVTSSPPPCRPPRQRRGGALMRAMTSRGRGYRYESLDSGQETECPTSCRSSPSPSPPYTPPPRSPHPGILINSTIARQGIKRLTR